MFEMSTMTILMGFGIALTIVAALSFHMITGRQAPFAFEDGDAGAVPLALMFRILAAPGILVCSQFSAFTSGKAGGQALGGVALGLLWGAVYGIGLGAIA